MCGSAVCRDTSRMSRPSSLSTAEASWMCMLASSTHWYQRQHVTPLRKVHEESLWLQAQRYCSQRRATRGTHRPSDTALFTTWYMMGVTRSRDTVQKTESLFYSTHVRRDEHRVFGLCGAPPIGRHHCPAIVEHGQPRDPLVQRRLDGEHHSRNNRLRRHMHDDTYGCDSGPARSLLNSKPRLLS